MGKKTLDTKTFIERAQKIHGNKYEWTNIFYPYILWSLSNINVWKNIWQDKTKKRFIGNFIQLFSLYAVFGLGIFIWFLNCLNSYIMPTETLFTFSKNILVGFYMGCLSARYVLYFGSNVWRSVVWE